MNNFSERQKVELELKNAVSRVVHLHKLPSPVQIIVQGSESSKMYIGTFNIEYQYSWSRSSKGAQIYPVDYFMVKADITLEQLLARYNSDKPLIFREELAKQLGENIARLDDGHCYTMVSGRRVDFYIPNETMPVLWQ